MTESHQHIDAEEIVALLPKVIKDVKPIGNGFYDVQQFANNLYAKLNNTTGFSSKDLASYLLLKSRKFGIQFFNSNAHTELEASLEDYYDSVPQGDDIDAQMRVAMSNPKS